MCVGVTLLSCLRAISISMARLVYSLRNYYFFSRQKNPKFRPARIHSPDPSSEREISGTRFARPTLWVLLYLFLQNWSG